MSHRRHRLKRLGFIGSVEQLDQRVLLTMGPVAPVTPAPTAVQTIPLAPAVSPVFTQAFQADMARLDAQFIGQAQALDNLLIARIDHYEAIFASGAATTDARIERALGHGSTVRFVRTASLSPLFNAEVARQEAFFNTKAARLSSGFQNQMSALASVFGQASAQFAAPATAFSGNVQAAATAFSNEVSSALTSVATSFANGSAALSSLVRDPGTAALTQSQTGATLPSAGGTGSASTGTIGAGVVPPFAQVFNSAFTQALNTVTANIQGISSGLQQNFGAFQTQFATNVSSLTSSFALSPFGTFSALPNYLMSTGAIAGSGGALASLTGGAFGTSGSAGTSIGTTAAGPGTAGGNTGATIPTTGP
jgi:hypothetical protein